MVACHLELGQLWRCPVTWCAVWKGSGRACLEHMEEKHGGSTLEIKTNVAQFFPPWTVTRDVWHDALRPDVSAITRLTHLPLSIPLSGAPPGKVPESCYPEAESAVAQPLPRRVSFTEDVDTLHTKDDLPVSSETSPPLTQPVVEELEEDTSSSEVDEIKICASQISPPLTQPVVEGIEDDTPTSEVDECWRNAGSLVFTVGTVVCNIRISSGGTACRVKSA